MCESDFITSEFIHYCEQAQRPRNLHGLRIYSYAYLGITTYNITVWQRRRYRDTYRKLGQLARNYCIQYVCVCVCVQRSCLSAHFSVILFPVDRICRVHLCVQYTTATLSKYCRKHTTPPPLKVQLHENTQVHLCWCQHDNLKTHPQRGKIPWR